MEQKHWPRLEPKNDTLPVVIPTFKNNHQLTKRNILSKLASVYDPTGLVSPAYLSQKFRGMNQCPKHLNLNSKNRK